MILRKDSIMPKGQLKEREDSACKKPSKKKKRGRCRTGKKATDQERMNEHRPQGESSNSRGGGKERQKVGNKGKGRRNRRGRRRADMSGVGKRNGIGGCQSGRRGRYDFRQWRHRERMIKRLKRRPPRSLARVPELSRRIHQKKGGEKS